MMFLEHNIIVTKLTIRFQSNTLVCGFPFDNPRPPCRRRVMSIYDRFRSHFFFPNGTFTYPIPLLRGMPSFRKVQPEDEFYCCRLHDLIVYFVAIAVVVFPHLIDCCFVSCNTIHLDHNNISPQIQSPQVI